MTNGGVIYKVGMDSFEFSVTHNFSEIADGIFPNGNLIKTEDGVLWGMTWAGGADLNSLGTLFSCNLDGTNYFKHHNFEGLQNFYIEGRGGLLITEFPVSDVASVAKSNMSLAPNPNNGNFYFLTNNKEATDANYEFKIFSPTGGLFHYSTGNLDEVNLHIAQFAPQLTTGIYFVNLTGHNSTFFEKIVVVK
jgi:Secretion system C-terminal sorting domain